MYGVEYDTYMEHDVLNTSFKNIPKEQKIQPELSYLSHDETRAMLYFTWLNDSFVNITLLQLWRKEHCTVEEKSYSFLIVVCVIYVWIARTFIGIAYVHKSHLIISFLTEDFLLFAFLKKDNIKWLCIATNFDWRSNS